MKIKHVLLSAIFAAVISTATADTYKIDNAHSTIAFKIRQYISSVNGKFGQFSGVIEVNREHPERSSVVAHIDVKSIDTGIRKRDNHLLTAEFFNAGKFPEIIFKSRGVKQTGPQSGDISGEFTMHGVTKPIVLHAKLAGDAKGESSHWEVTTDPLKRRDFDLMFSSGAEAVSGISQEVAVKIDIHAAEAR